MDSRFRGNDSSGGSAPIEPPYRWRLDSRFRGPPFVLVLVNARGHSAPPISGNSFDLPEKGLTDPNKVIVVRSGSLEVGILADAILGVRSVALQELQRWFRPRRACARSV